jgi:hypothetical protein
MPQVVVNCCWVLLHRYSLPLEVLLAFGIGGWVTTFAPLRLAQGAKAATHPPIPKPTTCVWRCWLAIT